MVILVEAVRSDPHAHSDLAKFRVFAMRRDLIGLGALFCFGNLPDQLSVNRCNRWLLAL